MLMLVIGDGRSRYVIYDKKTGDRHVAVSSKAEGARPVARFNPDDFIKGENDPYFYDRACGGRLIGVIEYNPGGRLFQQAVQAVGQTENPVLVVAKLK